MATPAAKRPPSRRAPKKSPPETLAGSVVTAPVKAIARQLRSWADTVLGVAGPATDMAFALAGAQVKGPRKKAAIARAGALLRQMRESAGLSVRDLGRAIDLSDPALIEQAESGWIVLPFEVILRLASVLGRSDPVTYAMKLTRAYNPQLWRALEELGVGRLVVQGGREREFANIYRANDKARRLSDEEFAAALQFARTAFDMAVEFRFPMANADGAPAKAPPGGSRAGRNVPVQ